MNRHARILVTGSGGVLGQAVLDLLRSRGFTDVLSPSRRELDLLDPRQADGYIDQHRPEAVIHLASVVYGLGGHLAFRSRALVDNTALNNHLFAALLRNPPAYVFFAGTVASYPHPLPQMPLREDDLLAGPCHDGEFGYAMAKRHALSYLRLLARDSGTRCTYGILTNLYGPGDRFDQDHGHVVPSLIAKAYTANRTQQPLRVWGDGSAQREFMHASDAALAIGLCMEREDSPSLINISCGESTSIGDVARIIARAFDIEKIEFQPGQPVGIERRTMDISRLRKLGFEPRMPLTDGLMHLAKWYREHAQEVRR